MAFQHDVMSLARNVEKMKEIMKFEALSKLEGRRATDWISSEE